MESDSQQNANKFNLIEEVRKRPVLWDFEHESPRDPKKGLELWNEIAQILNINVNICKKTWTNLRSQFRSEILQHIPERIAKAKEAGSYDPNKKYRNWVFFDALRFMEKRYPPKEKFHKKSGVNNNGDQTTPDLIDSSSLATESDDDIEIMDGYNLPMSKSRLIAEVRKRPALWDSKLEVGMKKRKLLWGEVGQILGVNAKICRQNFIVLRGRFRHEASRTSIRIARAKKAGTYDPNKKYYCLSYFDDFGFLSDGVVSTVTNNSADPVEPQSLTMESDSDGTANKLKLIEEVRKRPALWDSNPERVIDLKQNSELWNEIAATLAIDVNVCKEIWKKLCSKFRYQTLRCIPKAKEAKPDEPNKKKWVLFDALRFIENRYPIKETVDPKTVENNNSDQTRIDGVGSSGSLRTESDNGMQMSTEVDKLRLIQEIRKRRELWDTKLEVGSNKRNNLWSEVRQILGVNGNACQKVWTNLRVQYRNEIIFRIPRRIAKAKKEGSYDPNKKYYSWHLLDALRFLENGKEAQDNGKILANNSDSGYCQTENDIDDVESHNNLDQDYIDNDLFVKKGECETNSNENTVLLIDAAVKEEPELQIDMESHSTENEDNSQNVTSMVGSNEENEEFSYCVKSEYHHPSTSPDLNDEDYVFLCSFLSHTKAMTPLQKMEFHLDIQKLLPDTFPAFTPANSLEKQFLQPEDHDPDKKFLISLWTFMKSLTLLQNLQFRIEIPQLLFKILFPETSQLLNSSHA